MKQLIITILACAACAIGAQAQTIEFAAKTQDFGTVPQAGPQVECKFEFANTGDKPLVIISANSSCGCTKPHYPNEPVAPGAKGIITLKFNPKHQLGEVNKSVTVRTNDPKRKKVTLRITGIVKE